MRLDLLAKVLEDAGLGQRGTDIFVHRMPADVQKGILLRLPLDGVPRDAELPGYFKTEFQAIVRDIEQGAGDDKAARVKTALEMYRRRFEEGGELLMQVNHIYLEQLPIVYMRSEAQGIEWSLNFWASYTMPGR